MPSRRRYLAAALVVASAAGCSDLDPTGGGDGTRTDDPGDTDPTDATGTAEATGTPTETVPGHSEAAQEPDPDLPISVQNRHDEPRSLSLAVARDGGDVVHESDHDLDPGDDYEAYNLREADPEGVERFDVIVEAGDARREISVRTNECYGNARVGFDAAGELFASYDIC